MMEDDKGTSLVTEYSQTRASGVPTSMRAEFVLQRLYRGDVAPASIKKGVVNASSLGEQLRAVEERHRADVAQLEDLKVGRCPAGCRNSYMRMNQP